MSTYHNEKLDKLYKKLPKLDCKKLCVGACSIFPVGTTERKRIEKFLGHDPFPQLEQITDKLINHKNKCESIECTLLDKGMCSIYKIRPLICRLYGLTKKLRCHYGCEPEQWLSEADARKMLKKARYYEEKEK